jgi:Domain of unknown function (DUF1707)
MSLSRAVPTDYASHAERPFRLARRLGVALSSRRESELGSVWTPGVSPSDGGPQLNRWSSVTVMEDASLRASDADRERALVVLREHLVAGRLTLEEFCERVDAALRARVTGELAHLQDDCLRH